jgi:hypothetical protein
VSVAILGLEGLFKEITSSNVRKVSFIIEEYRHSNEI